MPTNAAQPELDPPVTLVSSWGLRTGPEILVNELPVKHWSSQTAVPAIIPPANTTQKTHHLGRGLLLIRTYSQFVANLHITEATFNEFASISQTVWSHQIMERPTERDFFRQVSGISAMIEVGRGARFKRGMLSHRKWNDRSPEAIPLWFIEMESQDVKIHETQGHVRCSRSRFSHLSMAYLHYVRTLCVAYEDRTETHRWSPGWPWALHSHNRILKGVCIWVLILTCI